MFSKFTEKADATPEKMKKSPKAKEIPTAYGLPKDPPIKGAKPKKFTKASGKMKIKAKAKKPIHKFFVS